MRWQLLLQPMQGISMFSRAVAHSKRHDRQASLCRRRSAPPKDPSTDGPPAPRESQDRNKPKAREQEGCGLWHGLARNHEPQLNRGVLTFDCREAEAASVCTSCAALRIGQWSEVVQT